MDYDALADQARPALILAAMRRTTVTYGELAKSISFDTSIPLSHHMKRVLDRVSDRCIKAGEPSLAVLVVNADTGVPGDGFTEGSLTWMAEARKCFKRWSPA
ncbi:MAG: hypothetical protein KKE65_05175 [Actinobacteria bacterium]|jgi:hypothetical protein|nr:hypothetical protein [Actinomycetota bacterium]MBU2111031.1 hypothetical protein [Actinomycetota bacterium]